MLVSVGGGGLIGGIAAYYAGATRIVGVEPEGRQLFNRALEAGEPVDVPVSGIAADSLGARRLGSLAFPILRQFDVQSLLVTDAEIVAAQQALWDVLRVVVEPGGAAAFRGAAVGTLSPATRRTRCRAALRRQYGRRAFRLRAAADSAKRRLLRDCRPLP